MTACDECQQQIRDLKAEVARLSLDLQIVKPMFSGRALEAQLSAMRAAAKRVLLFAPRDVTKPFANALAELHRTCAQGDHS